MTAFHPNLYIQRIKVYFQNRNKIKDEMKKKCLEQNVEKPQISVNRYKLDAELLRCSSHCTTVFTLRRWDQTGTEKYLANFLSYLIFSLSDWNEKCMLSLTDLNLIQSCI